MGTIQEPDPDREWLKRSYSDTGTDPYSIDARTEMMGRVATGSGRRGRVARIVLRTVAAVTLLAFAGSVLVGIIRLVT